MAENFCYNQNGINHILEQFGDAISNTKTESLITSIEKLKMVVNSFDSGDILVKNDSTTLFHTSYKDDGFG